jgi:toxin-antitoxin system PIN domain toxin
VTTYFCDSSVWVALAISEHEHHSVANQWFDSVPDTEVILFCRETQQSFMRLLTNAAVHGRYGQQPLTNDAAWRAYDAALADPRIRLEEDEPPGLERWWRQYSQRSTASPKLWMDAYLAAFARAGDYRLVTIDAAFKQFAGLDLLLLD